jgi:branched-chain amino acid transport system substrate-binding protein
MSIDTAFYSLDQIAATTGKHKMYVLYCAEAAPCAQANTGVQKYAQANGITITGSEQISIAQPDFTSECLNAQGRSGGADMVLVGADTNTVGRVADSCARQGYHPIFVEQGASVSEDLKSNAHLDGLVTAQPIFPWFLSNTPATQEFVSAMNTYAGGQKPSQASAAGWAAAKLFQKAASHIASSAAPTIDAIFAGLWSMRGETLGGLVAPLTFGQNQPAPDAKCFFPATLEKGTWAASGKVLCRP